MDTVTLRPYQAVDIRQLRRKLDEEPRCLLSSPPGSGKSLELQVLLTLALGASDDKYVSALVITPQLQIEAGFEPTEDKIVHWPKEDHAVTAPITIRKSDWFRARESTNGARSRFYAHLRNKKPSSRVLLTSHAAIVRWIADLPKSLVGRILVVDEAHHGSETNHAGKFIKEWVKRGGKAIFVTATAYRMSGDSVIDHNIPAVRRSLADLSATGYAPKNFIVRSQRTDLLARSSNELAGKTQPASIDGDWFESSCTHLAQLWASDGRPVSVFIVPQNKSKRYSKTLKEKLEVHGASVFDAVGVETSKQQDLEKVLRHERSIPGSDTLTFVDRLYDTYIACKRFDEGTDNPLVSHVYNIGIPTSLLVVEQRSGRAVRSKALISGYPERHKDKAVFTFLVPRAISDAAWSYFAVHHNDFIFMLATIQADAETGKSYLAGTLRVYLDTEGRKGGRWKREQRQTLEDIIEDVMSTYTLTEHEAVLAARDLIVAELALKRQDKPLSVKNVRAQLAASGITKQAVTNACNLKMLRAGPQHPAVEAFLRRAKHRYLDGYQPGIRQRIVRKDLQDDFDAATAAFEDEEFSNTVDDAISRVAKWTGKSGKKLAEELHRINRAQAPLADEKAVRQFIQGMSCVQYDALRRKGSVPNGFPASSVFSVHYGKTYKEMRDGPFVPWASVEDVRAYIEKHNLTYRQYDALKRNFSLPVNFPRANDFRHIYEQTFQQVRDGHSRNEWSTEEAVRPFTKGKTCRDFDEWRLSYKGKLRIPMAGSFLRVFGKSYREVRDGWKRSEYATEEKIRRSIQGMSRRKYEWLKSQKLLPANFPHRDAFPRLYGKTFSQVRDDPARRRK